MTVQILNLYIHIYIFYNTFTYINTDFPGGSDGKSVCLQCRRPGLDPWVGRIPWRRKWQPTPVFLPGKFQARQRSLVGYSPWGCKESDTTERLHFTSSYIYKYMPHNDTYLYHTIHPRSSHR